MTLRLNGSSSGYTEIDAPAAAGSNTLTLPTGNGSANQFFKNGSTAGELEYSSMVETTTGVGIGTSSPDANLKIQPSDSDNPANAFAVRQNNAADTAQTTFSVEASPTDGVSRLISSATSTPQLAFYTGGSESIRIDNSGYLRLTSNSPGLQFNGDTAAANALNDYEEGTWTPTIDDGITSPVLQTANGYYRKIGRTVFFNFEIRVTSGTPNSNIFAIGGLPYASANVPQNFGSVNINFNGLLTGFTELRAGHITTGATNIRFYNGKSVINGNTSGVNWVNGSRFMAAGFLMTA